MSHRSANISTDTLCDFPKLERVWAHEQAHQQRIDEALDRRYLTGHSSKFIEGCESTYVHLYWEPEPVRCIPSAQPRARLAALTAAGKAKLVHLGDSIRRLLLARRAEHEVSEKTGDVQ